MHEWGTEGEIWVCSNSPSVCRGEMFVCGHIHSGPTDCWGPAKRPTTRWFNTGLLKLQHAGKLYPVLPKTHSLSHKKSTIGSSYSFNLVGNLPLCLFLDILKPIASILFVCKGGFFGYPWTFYNLLYICTSDLHWNACFNELIVTLCSSKYCPFAIRCMFVFNVLCSEFDQISFLSQNTGHFCA